MDQGECWTAVKLYQSCHPRWSGLSQFEHFCFKLFEKGTEHKTSPLDQVLYRHMNLQSAHNPEIRKRQDLQKITPGKHQCLHTHKRIKISLQHNSARGRMLEVRNCSEPWSQRAESHTWDPFPRSLTPLILVSVTSCLFLP